MWTCLKIYIREVKCKYWTQKVIFTHPPKVLPVGIFWQSVIGIAFAHKGAKACPFGDKLFTDDSKHLLEKENT